MKLHVKKHRLFLSSSGHEVIWLGDTPIPIGFTVWPTAS